MASKNMPLFVYCRRLQFNAVRGKGYKATLVKVANSLLKDFLTHLKLTVDIFRRRLVGERTIAIVTEEIFEKAL